MGSFVFSGTLVVGNVILCSEEVIKLPKYGILKELSFYLISIIVVSIFGYMQTSGYAFVAVYMSCYVLYIVSTLIAESMDNKLAESEGMGTEDNDIEGQIVNDEENKSQLKVNDSRAFEDEVNIEDKDEEKSEDKTFYGQFMDTLVDDENSPLENLILVPLSLCTMLTVTFLANPFMKTFTKFLIIPSAILFTIVFLELAGDEPDMVTLSIGAGVVTLIFVILELVKFSTNILEICYEFLSVFAAIGWISIFSNIIIDFINFLSFYFNINKVILSSLLLSAGNTIGDFFGNGALSKNGEAVMGAMASYGGQIFNNYVGFSATVLMCA